MAYNEKTRKYTLLADRRILGKQSLGAKIVSRLNLPVGQTKIDSGSSLSLLPLFRAQSPNR